MLPSCNIGAPKLASSGAWPIQTKIVSSNSLLQQPYLARSSIPSHPSILCMPRAQSIIVPHPIILNIPQQPPDRPPQQDHTAIAHPILMLARDIIVDSRASSSLSGLVAGSESHDLVHDAAAGCVEDSRALAHRRLRGGWRLAFGLMKRATTGVFCAG